MDIDSEPNDRAASKREMNRCPICQSDMPANWSEYPEYPFCCKRCRLVDLGRWLGEDYKVSKQSVEES